MTRVAGVDGVGDGWVIALVTDTGQVGWQLVPGAAAVLAATGGCAAVAVDVPLRLPDAGYRQSEVRARERLGRARSSIFYTPVRAVLDCATYEEACAESLALTGRKISRQTWGLRKKVRDWDRTDRPGHVVEAHPELSFRAMAPDLCFAGKKTTPGVMRRMDVLDRWLAGLRGLPHATPPAVLWEVLAGVPGTVPVDDALDALACAWTARRVAASGRPPGGAEPIGVGSDLIWV
jgi:predicted RNase H-like nuclease